MFIFVPYAHKLKITHLAKEAWKVSSMENKPRNPHGICCFFFLRKKICMFKILQDYDRVVMGI